MQKCTPLEKRILWSRAKILLFWLWWILCYVFMFWYHWILGVLVLTASIFLRFITAWERNYFFSKEDYFKKYARSHSWEERLELSEESEKNGKYITIGEAVFLEEFVLLTKLGAVLNYREIHHFSYQESKTKSGLPKHYFNIYGIIWPDAASLIMSTSSTVAKFGTTAVSVNITYPVLTYAILVLLASLHKDTGIAFE